MPPDLSHSHEVLTCSRRRRRVVGRVKDVTDDSLGEALGIFEWRRGRDASPRLAPQPNLSEALEAFAHAPHLKDVDDAEVVGLRPLDNACEFDASRSRATLRALLRHPHRWLLLGWLLFWPSSEWFCCISRRHR